MDLRQAKSVGEAVLNKYYKQHQTLLVVTCTAQRVLFGGLLLLSCGDMHCPASVVWRVTTVVLW